MKDFIRKIVFLSLPVLLFPLMIFIGDLIVFSTRSENLSKVLVLGDSHTETGIKTSSENSILNISQSSESYVFTYLKLKKIFNSNKGLIVLLGFSPHNTTFFQDVKTFGLNGSTRYKSLLPRYAFILDKKSLELISSKANYNFSSLFLPTLKHNLKSILNGDNSYVGSYRESLNSNLDTALIDDKVAIHFYDSDENIYQNSLVQYEYLKKINQLCKLHDSQLILVNLPTYSRYKDNIPESTILTYKKWIEELNSMGAGIFDYSEIDLPNDHFGDGDHLNSLGANFIAPILFKDLDKYR